MDKDYRLKMPDCFDERAEVEMGWKGWIPGVMVTGEDGTDYPVCFYDPVSLYQDIGFSAQRGEPFCSEPGMIVLPEVTMEAIELAVDVLWSEGFFQYLRPWSYAAGPEGSKYPDMATFARLRSERAERKYTVVMPDSVDDRAKILLPLQGYLGNVKIIAEGGTEYPASFVSPVRLYQDLVGSAKHGRPFYAEPGLIAVSEVTMTTVLQAIDALWKDGFFEHVRPWAYQLPSAERE